MALIPALVNDVTNEILSYVPFTFHPSQRRLLPVFLTPSYLDFTQLIMLRLLSKAFYHHIPSQIRSYKNHVISENVEKNLFRHPLPSLRSLTLQNVSYVVSRLPELNIEKLVLPLCRDIAILQGVLRPVLSSLTSLTQLQFWATPVHGLIFPPQLKSLEIHAASDSAISSISTLQHLHVTDAHIDGSAFVNMPHLTSLHLNYLGFRPPSKLPCLSNLKSLCLVDHGAVIFNRIRLRPFQFDGLMSLRELSIDGIRTTLKNISSLHSLVRLKIQDCSLLDQDAPSALSALTSLVQLVLELPWTPLNSWYPYLTSLKALSIASGGELGSSLSVFSNLEYLVLNSCRNVASDSFIPLASSLRYLVVLATSLTDEAYLSLTCLKFLVIDEKQMQRIGCLPALVERGVLVQTVGEIVSKEVLLTKTFSQATFDGCLNNI